MLLLVWLRRCGNVLVFRRPMQCNSSSSLVVRSMQLLHSLSRILACSMCRSINCCRMVAHLTVRRDLQHLLLPFLHLPLPLSPPQLMEHASTLR